MKWQEKEEEIVVEFFFRYKDINVVNKNIDILMDLLHKNGFPNRDIVSTKMRIANISYQYCGKGLSGHTKQTVRLVNKYKD